MKNLSIKTKAKITAFRTYNGKRYAIFQLEKNNKQIQIPEEYLKHYQHPSTTLQVNDEFYLVGFFNPERGEHGACFFTPDLRHHPKKCDGNSSTQRGIPQNDLYRVCKQYSPPSPEQVMRDFSIYSQTISPEQRMLGLQIVATSKSNDDLVRNLSVFMGMEGLNMIPESESDTIEFKSSIFHSANPKDQSSNHLVIISSMIGLANNRGGKIFVGINNRGEIVGIEDELQRESPFNTVADLVNDFQNRIYQLTNSHVFMRSVSFEFLQRDQKVFLQISVPKSPEIILLRGSILLVRDAAGTRQLKNHDLINFIKSKIETI